MGFSALAIAERVGHESVDITYRYAHLFPTRQTEMADKLDVEHVWERGNEKMERSLDSNGRWRHKTVAFRVSGGSEGFWMIVLNLSGLTKQDYIMRRLLHREVVVRKYTCIER